MRRRLFTYMLALAIIVLFFLACGLFFLGHFTSSEKKRSHRFLIRCKPTNDRFQNTLKI